jgi:hypothetical protein
MAGCGLKGAARHDSAQFESPQEKRLVYDTAKKREKFADNSTDTDHCEGTRRSQAAPA